MVANTPVGEKIAVVCPFFQGLYHVEKTGKKISSLELDVIESQGNKIPPKGPRWSMFTFWVYSCFCFFVQKYSGVRPFLVASKNTRTLGNLPSWSFCAVWRPARGLKRCWHLGTPCYILAAVETVQDAFAYSCGGSFISPNLDFCPKKNGRERSSPEFLQKAGGAGGVFFLDLIILDRSQTKRKFGKKGGKSGGLSGLDRSLPSSIQSASLVKKIYVHRKTQKYPGTISRVRV